MNNVIKMKDWVKEDKTLAHYPMDSMTSWSRQDITEFPADMVFDADIENLHHDIEELAKDCHRAFITGHELLIADFIDKWDELPKG